MTTKILVSACLLGRPVRYDGSSVAMGMDILNLWKDMGLLVPLCPEIAAGFAVPRSPAEIEPGRSAADVLNGEARVIEKGGCDVTGHFISGAQIALQTARANGCTLALLTDGSPSCGSSFIYSGHHDGRRRDGQGVVSHVLCTNGIEVFAHDQIAQLAARLRELDIS